jgi:uncharacterized membrane protein YqiK
MNLALGLLPSFVQMLLIIILIILIGANFYVIVDVSEAHVVVTPKGKMIISSDPNISSKNWYIRIPKRIPFIGRSVRIIDVSVHETIIEQETYEKEQARYLVKSSTKYRVVDVAVAAETFRTPKELEAMLFEIIQSAVRAVTVKYEITTARAEKSKIESDICAEMSDDFKKYGLEIYNFNLVDFKDTPQSKAVSSISERREAQITSDTAIEVAGRLQASRVKQAEADQTASLRETEANQIKEQRVQESEMYIQKKRAESEKARLEVVQVQTIMQQNIDKEKAIILAEQEKVIAEINKDKLREEGAGQRLKLEEIAKGEAAAIRENLVAEAEGKQRLQEALSKFTPEAINAMVAPQVVEAYKLIGVASAEALKTADFRVFAGSGGESGFDIGKVISATMVSNEETAGAILNRISKPHDLGIGSVKVDKQTLAEKLEG